MWDCYWEYILHLTLWYRYTPEELQYMPIGTVKYNPPRRLRTKLANPNAPNDDTSDEDKNVSMHYIYLVSLFITMMTL